MSNPIVSIEDYTAPEKQRPENAYDAVVESVAEFKDHTKSVVIKAPEADIKGELRKFREAVRHAGRVANEREKSDADKDGIITVRFTIGSPRPRKSKDEAESVEAPAES